MNAIVYDGKSGAYSRKTRVNVAKWGLGLARLALAFDVAATCNVNILPSTPDARFELKADGTLVDSDTKLMWMRCSLGQTWDGTNCNDAPSEYDWKSALSSAESSEFAGYQDWRLPNLKELSSIIEQQCYDPSINETAFPNTPAKSYWTSSPYISSDKYGWDVSFHLGYNMHHFKTFEFHVRLVRTDND